MDRVLVDLEGLIQVEQQVTTEGRAITMVVAPGAGSKKKKKPKEQDEDKEVKDAKVKDEQRGEEKI